jgi:hypothetical protein
MEVSFENITLTVRESSTHEWLLETTLVADGYGVTPQAVRNHKSRRADELIKGKHYVSVTKGDGVDTFWTKKGVVRLGFFIKSKQAKKFRDWAEDLIVNKKPLTQSEIILAQAQNLVAIERKQTEIDGRVQVLEAKQIISPEFYAVAGYATLRGVTVSRTEAAALGRKCSKICRQRSLPTDTTHHPAYGSVKTYHRSVLEEVFNDEYFKS